MIELSNNQLILNVKEEGAEMCSLIQRNTNQEYIWKGDPKYWKRHAPVLFPIVGSVWNGEYHIDGQTYHLPQHGFARDQTFKVISATNDKAVFQLHSSPETLEIYPYQFILNITYELQENTVKITWTVENPSDETIYFQIGAHPAFNYPDFKEEDSVKGYLKTGTEQIDYRLLGEKGCLHTTKAYALKAENGLYPLQEELFDKDALIIEYSQTNKISLSDREKRPYLSVSFDAPVVGLWSPAGKNAPFICIEPWYGRCDEERYTGDFRKKAWMNELQPHHVFERSYTITISPRQNTDTTR